MDVSSVNATPVSTVLESPQRVSQQQVQQRSEQESQAPRPQPTQETSSSSDGRVGSRVDVFV